MLQLGLSHTGAMTVNQAATTAGIGSGQGTHLRYIVDRGQLMSRLP